MTERPGSLVSVAVMLLAGFAIWFVIALCLRVLG